ncbi:MAG: transposase zinc-binding domain-containing protein [Acidobacteria bacterium]|nr:transposase zinc-binding domain-containing protein [Acidobacteriota bacterium]
MTRSILRQIFRDHWESFQPKLSSLVPEAMVDVINEVVEKMLGCRDPEQGYYEYRCLKCGYRKTVAMTCKSRFCPSCGKVYVDRWVEGVVKEVIDVTHRHVVLTIPAQLRAVIYQRRELLAVMMEVAAQTVREVIESQRAGLSADRQAWNRPSWR